MSTSPGQPIGLICSAAMLQRCMSAEAWEALNAQGPVRHLPCEEPSSFDGPPPPNPAVIDAVVAFVQDLEVVVIGPGAPRFDKSVLDRLPNLRFLGELEGDRFAHRIDLAETRRRSIRTVDTSNGSSYPVAEWALALMMIALRGASDLYRRMAAGEILERPWLRSHMNFRVGELTGRRVGLVGCGHIGRRLLELLAPFRTVNAVYDPFVPPVVADIYDLHVLSLDDLFASSDVIVCTLPLTPATQGLLGARQFDLMRPDTVFVNVSRGKVVDTQALVARLSRGDIWAGLDVVEPENPVPVDHPLRSMSNVFLTPHIAGVTSACGPRFVTLMADEIGRFLAREATRFDLVARSELSTEASPSTG